MGMNLVAELEHLAGAIGADADAGTRISVSSVAERIAKSMDVKSDEVAILALSARRKHLYFLAPEALKNVGYIPLSSATALVARTARESRPEIDNNFVSARHARVFEGVRTGPQESEAIQKIISAPILNGDQVIGVIQVSRKGANANSAGPDFTSDELGRVLALCRPLGKLLRHFVNE
jgi:signal transduction protein with GAF and PtsI domain